MYENYREIVHELFEKKLNTTIANSSNDLAAIFFKEVFDHASEIRMLCRSPNLLIFDRSETFDAVEKFLKEGKKLYLGLQQKMMPQDSRFMKLITTAKNTELYLFPELYSKGKSIEFTVIDKCGYRFKPNRDFDSSIVSANDIPFALTLKEIFDNCLPTK